MKPFAELIKQSWNDKVGGLYALTRKEGERASSWGRRVLYGGDASPGKATRTAVSAEFVRVLATYTPFFDADWTPLPCSYLRVPFHSMSFKRTFIPDSLERWRR
jgi:hypothetical protein